MRVDLTDIEDRSFEAIPPGQYVVKIVGCTEGETKDNPGNKLPPGTPMLNWEFTVERDVKGDEKYANRHLWTNTIIHPNTLFSLKRLLKSTGAFSEEQLEGALDFNPEDVFGATVIAAVTQREYNGEMRNNITTFKSLSELDDRVAAGSLLP